MERKLRGNGALGHPSNVGLSAHTFSAAEDGRMFAADSASGIEVRTFHPNGTISEIHVQDLISSLALTGPVVGASPSLSAGSLAVANRFLFFRKWRPSGSRVMMRKVDDSTGKFIGVPKAFTKFKPDSTNGASCNKNALKAQVWNPQTRAKVGSSKLLIGCNELQAGGVFGINVTQFQF